MDSSETETKEKKEIEEAVRTILATADLETMTEHNVRKQASKNLGIDLSVPHLKSFVRRVVESFLAEKQSEYTQNNMTEDETKRDEQGEGEEEEEERGRKRDVKEYDDDGDIIICHLSDKRRVTIQDFRGKTLVSIREYYKKDGKMLPTSKGISLTVDQWLSFKKNVPAIEKAIGRLRG